MKKITFFCLVLLSVLMLSSVVYAAGELTVEAENVFLYSEDAGFYYAKLTNTGDRAVYIGTPSLEIFDANADTILTDGYVVTFPYNSRIDPGQSVFIQDFIWNSDLKRGVGSWELSYKSSSWGSSYTEIPCTYELYYVQQSNDNAVFVTFTNTTDSMLHDFSVAAAVYDQEGNLIFVDFNSLDDVGLHPGSTLTAVFDIDYSMTRAYASENIVPTTVEAHVWVDED